MFVWLLGEGEAAYRSHWSSEPLCSHPASAPSPPAAPSVYTPGWGGGSNTWSVCVSVCVCVGGGKKGVQHGVWDRTTGAENKHYENPISFQAASM